MAFDRLGILSRDKVKVFLQPAYPNFVKHGYRVVDRSAFRTRVAFAGNVYLQASQELPFRDEPVLTEIEERVLARKQERLTDSLWDLITAEIDQLNRPVREQLRLAPDCTFLEFRPRRDRSGRQHPRAPVLGGLKHEYDFFGNFIEPKSADTCAATIIFACARASITSRSYRFCLSTAMSSWTSSTWATTRDFPQDHGLPGLRWSDPL